MQSPKLIVPVLAVPLSSSAMAAIDPPQNLRINYSEVSWSPVDGAAGYNLYRDSEYVLTVFDIVSAVAGSGEYRVVAFSEGGADFSPLWAGEAISYRVRPVPAAPVP